MPARPADGAGNADPGPAPAGHPADRAAIGAQLDDAARLCAEHGAQLTDLRRHVLSLVLAADTPATAYQLLDRLRAERRGATPPTIYRALEFLIDQGLVHKIERLNAFISCTHSTHRDHAVQFLICRACGTVAEMEDDAVSAALRRAAERQGFRPRSAVVEIDGLCARCASASPARGDRSGHSTP